MDTAIQTATSSIIARPAKFKCSFSVVEAIGSIIIWILLTIVTLGLALLVFPYYLNRAVLNKTEVVDNSGKPIGRLDCQFNIASSIGHLIIWAILIFVTFGLASFIYVYRVLRVVLNETRISYY